MAERTLYMSTRSPFARKVRIILQTKGLPFREVSVDFANLPPEFVAITPIQKIPVFVDEDGTVVWDSTCIASWLEERYPHPPLLPTDLQDRNQCRLVEDLADSLADQAVILFQQSQRPDGGDLITINKSRALVTRILLHLEVMTPTTGYFAGGENWDLRDAALLSSLSYLSFRHGSFWHDAYPNLATYEMRANTLAVFRDTLPHL